MNIYKKLHIIAVTALLLFPSSISALPTDKSHKVERLSFADRLSFRTNGTDWLLMIPNVGVEYDLRNTNWNRYALNLNLRYRPASTSLKVGSFVWNGTEVKLEGRMYWREHKTEKVGSLTPHTSMFGKLMSCRRKAPKHPNTVFYRGVYASYGNEAFRISGDGQRADFAQAGITWGFVKPLYAFSNGNSLDFEIGVSGGVAFAKSETFCVDDATNEYRTTETNGWRFVNMPVINDIHAAIVYRLGKYPIQKKYRWRQDVDLNYQDRINDLCLSKQTQKIQKREARNTYRIVASYFRSTYDSVIAVRRKERQAVIDRTAPKHVTTTKEKKEK